MNNNLYRIVFNKARGMRMVVPETANSQTKGDAVATGGIVKSKRTWIFNLKAIPIAIGLGFGYLAILPAQGAGIVADGAAPANQRPIVLNAGNNVPLVNIQTPSAAGVSRNTYSQFDVGNQGAILNNSRTDVQTQLGGYVQANPYLATGAARVILNEVNSNNPSLLQGYVEVAGSRAQVVIANPSGITCDGCGFINTSRATLTTGTPNLIGGNLESYRVERGTVSAQGRGLDASTADYTDIIARAVNVNAGIWTNILKVTTGVNTVNADNSQATVITGAAASPAPSFAVDVASLGGMYAGKIMMIGTEAGVGVRNAGNIGASAGELVLTQDGRLENTGRINSAGNTTVTTTGNINNTGTIYAQGNTSLNTQSDVSNTGLIAAYGNTQISALGANSHITSTSSGILAAGLKTDGTLNGTGDLSVTATNQVSAVGQHLAAGTLRFSGQTLTLTQSQTSAQTIILSASHGALDATGATLSANGELNASATTLLTTDGAKLAANQLNISAHDLSNVAGELIQVGTGDTTINLLGNLDNSQGRIASNSTNLTLAADTLNNTQGKIEHAGTGLLKLSANQLLNTNTASIGTNADLVIEGGGIDNRGGRIDVQKNAMFTLSQDLDNTASLVRAGQTLTLSASHVINANTQGTYQGVANQGLMAQSVIINTATLNNNLGNISANDQLTLNSHGHLDNTQGLLSSAKAITLQDTLSSAKGLTITNTGGTIIAKDQATIDSASMTGDGNVYSRGNLNVNLDTDYNNTGILQTTQHLSFSTKGKLTNQSNILAGGNLGLSAADVDNQASGQMIGSNTNILASNSLTNRGLIDGGDTFINTVTLNNIGTGRIYGDHVAIQTDTLNNKEETLGGQTKAAVIAARDRLDIGAKTITNQEHALLFSAGDMAIGGGLDGNHQATGSADTLNNKSATIESLNNLSLSARQINNTNEHFSTSDVLVSIQNYDEFQGGTGLYRYAAPAGTAIYPIIPYCDDDCFNQFNSPTPNNSAYATSVRNALYQWVIGGTQYRDSYRYIYTSKTIETQLTTSDPGQILSGREMQLTAESLLNDKSKVVAGDALLGNIGMLINSELTGTRSINGDGTTYLYVTHDPSGGDNDFTEVRLSAYKTSEIQSITLTPTVYKQNTAPSGTGTQVSALSTSSVSKTVTSATGANATASANRTTGPDINIPNNSLFKVNPNAGNHYLVETDPSFTNYKTWLSSDYMLKALAYDPAATQKRLGDGFYEQKLMRDQITQLTGHRFLDGYASDEAQYQALMNNAVNYAQSVNLRPGIALSANQIAQLTTDIIWLVEQTVTLPDGSTTQALVPQVYVALKSGDLLPSGALISGNNIALNVNDALNNQGTIAGRNIVNISTANLNNLGGQIQGADLNLKALQDINNIGGSITASNNLTLQAGRDINVVSTTSTQTAASGSRTNVDRVAGLYVTSNLGNMVAIAGNNINLIAAQILHDAPTAAGIPSAPSNSTPANANQGTTVFSAGKDIDMGTLTASESDQIVWNSQNTLSQKNTREIGATIKTTGDLSLSSGQDIKLKATNITTTGSMDISAQRNVTIANGESSRSLTGLTTYDKGRTTTAASVNSINTSNLDAEGSVSIKAGGDTHVTSSTINSGDAITVATAGNLILDTAKESNRLDYAYNAKNRRDIIKNVDETIITNTLKANNDVVLSAAKNSDTTLSSGNLNITSTNINSQSGAVNLKADQNIVIDSADETHSHYEEHYSKSKSLLSSKSTLSIDRVDLTNAIGSNLSGNIVNVKSGSNIDVQSANIVATNNVDINAAGSVNITTAEQAHDETHFYEHKESGFLSGDGFGFTIGSRKLTTTNDGQQITHAGSTIGSINGDVNITAGNTYNQTGSDVLAPQGDINIVASDVNITAATNTNANQQTMKFKQTGLSVALSSSALNLAQSVAGTTQAAVTSDSSRNKALNALQTYANASTLSKQGVAAVDAIKAGDAQGAADAAGIRLSVSIGTSKASSSSTTTLATQQDSLVKSGGNVSIKTTENDINVIGSQIEADKSITLDAAKNINLIASADTESNNSQNKSSSTSIGVSVGLGKNAGLSLDIAASRGKGNANSDSTGYNNTHVTAGETLAIKSGDDTNLIGANAVAKKVIADIGGNLNVESLQDTASSHASQSNTGVGISIPVGVGAVRGSFSQSKQNSQGNYASVYEQSGIKAGDGGFQVNVNGNTDLKGAVIASDDKAIQDDKNSLSTQTLTTSDISNSMSAKAESSGLSASTNMLQGKYEQSKAIASNLLNDGSANQSDASKTTSAISVAQVTVGSKTTDTSKAVLTDSNGNAISTDTTNTSRSLAKADMQALQKSAQQEQADNMLAVTAVAALTDEAYRSRFQVTPKTLKAECPQGADCQANPKLLVRTEVSPKDMANAPPGSIVAVNGILNDEQRGAELAYQNIVPDKETGAKPSTVYLMYIAPASNTLSELLGVAYEKITTSADYGLANFLGYTNGQELYAALIKSREQQATESLGHSRGTLVQEAAFTILSNRPDSNGNTYINPNLSVRGVGGAANALEYTDKAMAVQGSLGNKEKITYNYFSNDPVPTAAVSGGNPGTWTLKDLWQVFSTSNSVHSCYGTGAAGCTQVEIPLLGGAQGTPDGNAKLIRYQGGQQVDTPNNLVNTAK